MMRSDFHTRARGDWVRSIDTVSVPSAASTTWRGCGDIAAALTPVMGSNRNHAHLPGGGGMDILTVGPASEPGCLDLHVGRNTVYRVRPRRLVLERIARDPAESFFLLELDMLAPSGVYGEREVVDDDDRPFRDEEITEVEGDRFYPRSVWDRDELPDGDPLPADAKLVVRLFAGKVLFVTKGSLWNGASATYDGRHARMSADDIRSVIERSIRAAA